MLKLGISLIFKDDMEANHATLKVRVLHSVCSLAADQVGGHASFKGTSSWFLESGQVMYNSLTVQRLTFKDSDAQCP